MPIPVDVDVLGRCFVLAGLPRAELEQLAALMRRRAFRRGEVVFHAGDAGDTLHLILEGRLKVVISPQADEEVILRARSCPATPVATGDPTLPPLRLTITRMVEVLAAGPARVGGMYPRKGALALGSDGDVVVFDPDARRTIRATDMHSACDYDPYEGWEVTGWPETVLSRGEIVFERGELAGTPGRGKLVPRAPYPA